LTSLAPQWVRWRFIADWRTDDHSALEAGTARWNNVSDAGRWLAKGQRRTSFVATTW